MLQHLSTERATAPYFWMNPPFDWTPAMSSRTGTLHLLTRTFFLALALCLGSGLLAQAPAPAPAAAAAPALPRPVGGDLLVAPTRLVFDAKLRSAQLTLLNTGSAPATYRLTYIRMEMNEKGELKEIASDGPSVAEDMVRYAPQQITLEPGVQQTVRILVRRPADLQDGEYRAHLLIRAVPKEDPTPVEVDPKEPNGVAIKLTPVYGVSIPVIVRQGDTPSTPVFAGLQVAQGSDGRTLLKFALQRQGGKESVFGNVQISPVGTGAKDVKMTEWRGIAVYPPLPERLMEIPLGPLKVPAGTTLRVAFVHPEKGNVMAESQIVVQ